jgi:1-acyl-sn-glycerol-3-phosphate acyltransferase
MSTIVRSAIFNLFFYIHTAGTLILFTPVFFFIPQPWNMAIVRAWARRTLWVLKAVVGTKVEYRGLENLPRDRPALISIKHQSLWETFALLPVLGNPGFVAKKQLFYVPIWGQWGWKAGILFVDRSKGSAALRKLAEEAEELAKTGRSLMIAPEGTRRTPGAPPGYQTGIAHLYARLKQPVVPVALNSGFYWPRRSFLRYPGTIVAEFLPPIEPGMSPRAFLAELEKRTEEASDRLIVEADAARPRPPFPPEAEARLLQLRQEKDVSVATPA